MNKNAFVILLILPVISLLSRAQVVTGTPPFQSFGGGPDVINLGNLNGHYSFPVFSRAGRGMTFSYALAYDTSVWTNLGGTWFPTTTFGLVRDVPALVGTVSVSVLQHRCVDHDNGQIIYWNSYTFGNYIDAQGTVHSFVPALYVHDEEADGICTNPLPTASGQAVDGSGIVMSVNYSPSATITLRDGQKVVPVLTGGSSGNETDSNGNQITTSTANGTTTFTDTLGSTALTITGTAPNPIYYKYTAPGGQKQLTVTYVTKTVQTNFGCPGVSEYGPISGSLVDKIALPDGSYYQFTYEPTPGTSNGNVTGRLASLSLPTGGVISYSFQGFANDGIECADGSTAGFVRTTPDGQTTYSRSLNGSTWVTKITDSLGNDTVINFAKDTVSNNFYETQRQVFQGASSGGALLLQTFNCWNNNFTNCPTQTVSSPITKLDHYQNPPGLSAAVSESTFNGYGLVTDHRDFDYGTVLVKDTLISYANLANGIVDHPASIVVKDGIGNVQSQVTYGYDETAVTATSGTPQHVGVSGSRGNQTSIAAQVSGTSTLFRTFSYFDTGAVNISTDVSLSKNSPGASTAYVYGGSSCGNSFPTQVNEPLGLSRSVSWNCTGGVSLSMTDENGKTVTTNYTDANFWRPSSVVDQLGNQTNIEYSGHTIVEGSLAFNNGASVLDIRSTLDELGRPKLSQRLQAPGSINYDSAEIDYDVVGRVSRATMSYSAAAGGTNSLAPAITMLYDALGRPTSITDAGSGTVTYTYSMNDVLQTIGPAPVGENTKRKQLEYDGLGRLTSVCETTTGSGSGACAQSNAQTGYWTKYTYYPLGYLKSVLQNAQASTGSQQGRSFTYDMLGRITSETDPETGTTTYTYDTLPSVCAQFGSEVGNLTAKTDANGNTSCYFYDSLHRLTDVGASGQSGGNYCKRFRDDSSTGVTGTTRPSSATYTMGRLVEAETDNCGGTPITDEWFGYSARGELTDAYESTPHSGGYYHITQSYWPHGAPKTVSGLPSMPTVYFGANDGTGLEGEGRFTKVTASSGQNPVTAATYTTSGTSQPIGSLTQVLLGSGDSEAFSYDPGTGRMSQYSSTIGSPAKTASGSLTWNANGTLKQLTITDPFNSSDAQSCSYAYDDLRRSSTVNCGSPWSQTFTYDAFGNLSKSGSISWLPSYGSTTNRYTLGGTSYDADGNLLNDTFNAYTWDVYGNLASTNGTPITYDALGRMVELGTTNQFVYQPGGQQPFAQFSGQNLLLAYVPLPGGLFAIYNGSGLMQYNHVDWLGSARIISTPGRGVGSDMAYAPFGEGYAGSGWAQFTSAGNSWTVQSSQNRGLDDFLYRRYSPVQGRWLSPDPAGLAAVDPANPQTWNRYAYVTNTPLSATDPLGLFGSDAIGSGDDGCYLTFSCTVYTDSFGMQVDSQSAQAALHNGSGVICPQCAGNPFLSVGPDNQIYNSPWSAPTGPEWVDPGRGDPDLIAVGAKVNWRTDQIWVYATGTFLTDPPGTVFQLETRGLPFIDYVRYPMRAPNHSVNAVSTPEISDLDRFRWCMVGTYLRMGGGGAVPMAAPGDSADGATIGEDRTVWGTKEYNADGSAHGAATGNAAAMIGNVGSCYGIPVR